MRHRSIATRMRHSSGIPSSSVGASITTCRVALSAVALFVGSLSTDCLRFMGDTLHRVATAVSCSSVHTMAIMDRSAYIAAVVVGACTALLLFAWWVH
jgi:hypothetical protein